MIVVGGVALMLLAGVLVSLVAIWRRLDHMSPQAQLQAFQQILAYTREAIGQYAEGSALLEQARQIREHPELMDAIPLRVAETLMAHVAAQTKSLAGRAQAVRAVLEQAQLKVAANQGSQLLPDYVTEVTSLEGELARLDGLLEEMPSLAKAVQTAARSGWGSDQL